MAAFLVFEGIDGAGKTTQASILLDTLIRKGCDALLTREPGGTPVGEAVAHWLRTHPDRSDLAELFLFCAARAEHVAQVIRPALDQGRIVVCDRYVASTLAYQGYGRGLDLELIRQVNSQATMELQPSLTILLDVPVVTAESRKGTANLDTFESERSPFRQRVREGYLAMAAEAPAVWLVVDGTLPEETVATKVWERVQALIIKRGRSIP